MLVLLVYIIITGSDQYKFSDVAHSGRVLLPADSLGGDVFMF